jgi:hypothetical protein
VQSYSQMTGKCVSALEFSNFSEFHAFGARYGGCAPRRVCPFTDVAHPVPEILDPPLPAVMG